MELLATNGRTYLDFIAGYGAAVTGHCHPRIVTALQQQAEMLMHVSTVGQTAAANEYSARLSSLVPIEDAKVFFGNSGSEAVEAALKLARYATGRPSIVAFGGGFHGRTAGSLSVTSSKASFRERHEPLLPGVHFVPYPRSALEPTLEALARLFVEQVAPSRVAAVIVEPVLGEGGYVPPPEGFLRALREVCDDHGIVLVFDEVQSGFGRTGTMFACEREGVCPDLMTLGKGIASGYPMGALAGRAALMDAWEPGAHGTTFGGGPLACRVASATLDVIEAEGLVANAARRGEEFQSVLREYAPAGWSVRGRGLMVGLQAPSHAHASRAHAALLEQGVIASFCAPDSSVVRFSPPLVLGDEHVERFGAALASAF
jgi:4-aminobutyrate aminotransferase